LAHSQDEQIEKFIQDLKSTDSNLRKQAIWALGETRDPQAVESLISALKDKDPDIRSKAAFALGKIADIRAVEALFTALRDENSGVRASTAWALEIITGAYPVENLIETLKKLSQTSGAEVPRIPPDILQGIVYLRDGKNTEAFTEFQAILLNPSLERWHPWAKQTIQSFAGYDKILEKDPALAIKTYEAMLEIEDDNETQQLNMCQKLLSLYENKQDYDGVIKVYRKMLKLTPDKIDYYNKLGRIYVKKGDRKNARATWNKMLQISENTSTLSTIASNFKNYEFYSDAETTYRKLIKINPTNYYYHRELAQVFQKQKLYEKATLAYKEALRLAKKSNRKYIERLLANLYQEAGMIKTIIKEKEEDLRTTDQKLVQLYKEMASSYQKLRQYGKAKEMYCKVLELSPEDEKSKNSLKEVEKAIYENAK